MSLFQAFNISASGMTAQQYRVDVISENVANATTTRTANGGPYTRQVVTFEEKTKYPFSHVLANQRYTFNGQGVRVDSVKNDTETEYVMEYDPSHPDADENGYVTYPNVNIVTEMTNLIDASRSYEANITAFEASKNMASNGLSIMQA